MTPITAAEDIYVEALGSLMAHTVRGVTNYFLRHRVELDLTIKTDHTGIIQLAVPGKDCTSVLMTHPVKVKMANGAEKVSRVKATIFVHKDANKHLARICIAHEIYHLLLELDAYLKSGGTIWANLPTTPEVEDACNQFAWDLCKKHDKFNRDEAEREKHVYFPIRVFDSPLKTNTTHNHLEWPAGIALDPNNAFHAGPKARLLN
jgi:hypothetical protein